MSAAATLVQNLRNRLSKPTAYRLFDIRLKHRITLSPSLRPHKTQVSAQVGELLPAVTGAITRRAKVQPRNTASASARTNHVQGSDDMPWNRIEVAISAAKQL